MCGRYTFTQPSQLVAQQFMVDAPVDLYARYNIAPSQLVPAVRQSARAGRELTVFQWGLVPSWSKDPNIGNKMINARSETAAEKPSFRTSMKYRRCLLPANGFYEWLNSGSRKLPHYIRLREGRTFAFAGLWEVWDKPEGYLETCAILTTQANDMLKPLHERMPVILHQDDYAAWLDPQNQKPEKLDYLLRPWRDIDMEFYPVGDFVSRVSNEGPDLIKPLYEFGATLELEPGLF